MWVTGLFATASDAEMALDNLDEAGFGADSVSVVARDPHVVATLTDAPGPLGRIAPEELVVRLGQAGMEQEVRAAYADALAQGAVCLVVFAPAGSEKSAAEILADQNANRVQVLRGDEAGS